MEIRLVHGWSIDLRERCDPTLRWKATAIRDNETEYGVGVDRAMALLNVALRCGFDGRDALNSFGVSLIATA